MSTDESVKQLHDRATRGVTLSADEQVQLDAWYAQQDREEDAVLVQMLPPQTLTTLQAQVDTTVSQMHTVTQRIQELLLRNESLRHEIVTLQRQLTRAQSASPT